MKNKKNICKIYINGNEFEFFATLKIILIN